jgi:hypothetical protein
MKSTFLMNVHHIFNFFVAATALRKNIEKNSGNLKKTDILSEAV